MMMIPLEFQRVTSIQMTSHLQKLYELPLFVQVYIDSFIFYMISISTTMVDSELLKETAECTARNLSLLQVEGISRL